jgi:hypothetical protein
MLDDILYWLREEAADIWENIKDAFKKEDEL